MSFFLTGSDSTIPGFTSVPFDLNKAIATEKYLESIGYIYGLDSKISLDNSVPPICHPAVGKHNPSIDCSGFFRYLLYKASYGKVVVPDGSYTQCDYLINNGFKHRTTSKENDPAYLNGLDKNYVYACFCRTGQRGETVGHVWVLFWNTKLGKFMSLESHAPDGVSSRLYDTPVLSRIVTDFFPIAKIS